MSEYTSEEMRQMLKNWRPPDASASGESSLAVRTGSEFLTAFCKHMWEQHNVCRSRAEEAAEDGDYEAAMRYKVRSATFKEAKEEAERIFFDAPNIAHQPRP